VNPSPIEIQRPDFKLIADLVEPGTRVLDLGCGTGELLQWLVETKQVYAQGVEISADNIIACAGRGLSVLQDDLDTGLEDFNDQTFDYVVLSQTLQVVKDPPLVVQEMLRVGKRAIVSIPNFAYWRMRVQLLLKGRMPKGHYFPYKWHDTPNAHTLTIADFRSFCHRRGIRIDQEIYLAPNHGPAGAIRRRLANFLCPLGIFVLTNAAEHRA